jgi:DNA (cytosine-5)-methyltransferase 1
MKYRLLDLFCCQGGAGMGYHRAGFEVTGVDINPQPRYPFMFIHGDALEYLAAHGHKYDVIHASPPCQAYSVTKSIHKNEHPMLIEEVRARLLETGKPYIIENVEGAPLKNTVALCGTMFGLKVYRHRLFECNPLIQFPPFECEHRVAMAPSKGHYHTLEKYEMITCVGHNFAAESGKIAMDIDWMTRGGMAQAIPPAYTEWIGKQLINYMRTP